jgi:hypothetical protein
MASFISLAIVSTFLNWKQL